MTSLSGYVPLAKCPLDAITTDKIAGFIAKRREAELAVASINRRLEVLRRMLRLPVERGRVDKLLPRVEMLPGENHRDRVLTADEDAKYLEAASAVGQGIVDAYHRALDEIRATQRGEEPIEPRDPFLLRDITTILIDCGLRPEECFRLRWENVQDGAVHIPFGKTDDARRTIPLTQRTADILEGRRAAADTEWVFPAPTRSGHVEKSSLKKQHPKACALAKVQEFPLYTFRHTCLTRWAARMDRYTLGYLAGHSDFSTTRRYTHPHVHTVREAIERARNGHDAAKPAPASTEPTLDPAPTDAQEAQAA